MCDIGGVVGETVDQSGSHVDDCRDCSDDKDYQKTEKNGRVDGDTRERRLRVQLRPLLRLLLRLFRRRGCAFKVCKFEKISRNSSFENSQKSTENGNITVFFSCVLI